MFPLCQCKWVEPQSRSNPFIVAVEVNAKYTHISHYCQYKWAESLKLFEPTFTDSYKQCCKLQNLCEVALILRVSANGLDFTSDRTHLY